MRQSLDDQWEPRRQVVARTAVQLHPLAILAGDYPEAIVFYLVQPLITRWRARGCCGKAWGNEAGWKGMLGTQQHVRAIRDFGQGGQRGSCARRALARQLSPIRTLRAREG